MKTLKIMSGMKKLKSLLTITVILGTAALSTNAIAAYSAFASGSNNSYGWANKETQKDANANALKICNEHSLKKDCTLKSTKAIVLAQGDGQAFGIGRDFQSKSGADKTALKYCNDTSCEIKRTTTEAGLYALAMTATDNGPFTHLEVRQDSLEDAKSIALEKCERKAGQKCTIEMTGAIPGFHGAQSSASNTNMTQKNCRPTTQTVRCSFQCTNGNCLVKYENGCQIRVNVPPQYNPFTNQWVSPNPAC